MNLWDIPILFSMPGLPELLIIFLIILLLLGAKRLPEIVRGLGQGIKEFRKAISGKNKDHSDKEETEDG